MIITLLFPFYFPYRFFNNDNTNNTISNNFINMATFIVGFHENAKKNMELLDSFKEVLINNVNSIRDISKKYIENEMDRNLKFAFFLTENMWRGVDQIPKPKETEEEKDKKLYGFYF